jgi:hypothetical protein
MAQVMAQPIKVYRGTLDEVLSHRNEIPPDAILELKVFEPQEEAGSTPIRPIRKRASAYGKYAFVPGGSEAFAREKQREIEREDRPRR